MKIHQRLALLCLLSFIVAFPGDAQNIYAGIFHPDPTATPKLSLGLSLKTLMAVVSVIGLWYDKTAGYAFLLGSSAQNLLVSCGDLLALQGVFDQHLTQIVRPVLEGAFRLFCFGYLAIHWRRMVGVREEVAT